MKNLHWLWLFLFFAPLLPVTHAQYANTNVTTIDLDLYSDSSPALDKNGVIYVSTWQGRVVAVNPDTSIRWSYRTHAEMKSSPAIADDGTIYVGGRDRRLYALTPGGHKKWTFKTGGWVDASVAIAANGDIYFGSWDKQFYALDPNGKKKWDFATGGEIESSAAIAADGTIYFGSHDRKLYALDATGKKRWEFATGGPITSSPGIGANGEIYFTSVDGKLYALNPDGTKQWDFAAGGTTESSPVVGPNGNIYVGVNSNYYAFSHEGQKLWTNSIWQYFPNDYIRGTGLIGADGLSYYTGEDQRFWAIGADGNWKWLAWLGAPSKASPTIAPDGTAYILSYSYHFHIVKGASPPAKSSWPMFRADAQHTGRVQPAR